jgi:alpha-beta hydrolase superfamily lysophospholipase
MEQETGMPRLRHWFEYFPGNHMWSQGMMFAIEMQTYGAAAISEVDQVGQRLVGHEGDNELWWAEWAAMANRLEAMAAKSEGEGHSLTAGACWLRAAVYYFCGERFLAPGSRKEATYRDCLRCFDRGTARRYPMIERLEVPFEGASLPALLFRAPDAAASAPAVICFDGLDNAKELSVFFAGVELANRGIHTLAIDGPGQGEALRLRKIPSRFDYEVPAGAAYDHLISLPGIDPDRVALMGFSMGGYYAPRAAAFDPRFAACVAWGGHFDYHAAWIRRRKLMEGGSSRLSAPSFQLPWVLGVADMDAAMEKLQDFTLEEVAERIACPFFCLHGEDDSIVPVEFAYQLHAAVGASDKTLRILTAAEGGSEHCQEDNRQIGSNIIADWLSDRLIGPADKQ